MFTLIAMGKGVAWVYSIVGTVWPGPFPVCQSRAEEELELDVGADLSFDAPTSQKLTAPPTTHVNVRAACMDSSPEGKT